MTTSQTSKAGVGMFGKAVFGLRGYVMKSGVVGRRYGGFHVETKFTNRMEEE